MTAPLDPETKRLRRLPPGALADEAYVLKCRIDAIKADMIRRGLKVTEGQAGRIALTPPGARDSSDRTRLLQALGISESEFVTRFCRTGQNRLAADDPAAPEIRRRGMRRPDARHGPARMLAVMASFGSIDAAMHRAGLELRAALMTGAPVPLLARLGTPAAGCVIQVLALGQPLRDWARDGWQGRPISGETAAGILIAALSAAAYGNPRNCATAHWRTLRRAAFSCDGGHCTVAGCQPRDDRRPYPDPAAPGYALGTRPARQSTLALRGQPSAPTAISRAAGPAALFLHLARYPLTFSKSGFGADTIRRSHIGQGARSTRRGR